MSKDIGHIKMAITPVTLKQLPESVAALVNDYVTGDKQQYWRLRELEFDPEALDVLPVGEESSTCECYWTGGWFWRGRNGELSLSPHLVQLDASCPADEFAWVVERENESGHEHITVWRIHVLRPEARDENRQRKSSTSVAKLRQVSERQFFELASTFQRKRELQRVLSIVEAAYGTARGATRVTLQGGDLYLGGSSADRHMDRISVFGQDGDELAPDFDLPFWQKQPYLEEMLAQAGVDAYNDDIDAYEDPAEGSKEFHIAAALEELIHAEFGFLPDEASLEFDLVSEETQRLLQLQFPSLFIRQKTKRSILSLLRLLFIRVRVWTRS